MDKTDGEEKSEVGVSSDEEEGAVIEGKGQEAADEETIPQPNVLH